MHEIMNFAFKNIGNGREECKIYDDPELSECCGCLRSQYFGGKKIDYSCEEKRILYVCKYFPKHVKEVSSGLRLIDFNYFDKIFEKGIFRILSIGGGPSSEIYAVKRLLNVLNNQNFFSNSVDVTIVRVDKMKFWDDIAALVNSRQCSTDFIKFLHKKNCCDVTDDNVKGISHTKNFNLILISYLISELDDDGIHCLSSHINNSASRKRCIILINDRPDDITKNKIRLLFEKISAHSIRSEEKIEHCDFSYPDEYVPKIKPKLKTSSARFTGIIS